MRAELRRSIFLACAGLLAGFALVVTLYGAGTLFKQGLAPRTGTPEGQAVPLTAPPADPAAPDVRPREEGAPAPGKPRAALEGRPIPEGAQVPDQALDPAQPQAQGKAATGAAPSFDIIRVEPNGEAVIAGRAPPNTTVELLRDNAPMARALVDPSGQFALVPPALPTGGSEITLRVTGADGRVRVSRDSVSVVVAPDRKAKPLIALTSPDKPTIVLSQPDPVTASTGTPRPEPKTAEAGTGKSETVKPEAGKPDPGRLATNMPGPGGGATPPGGPSARRPAADAAKPAEAEKAAPVKIVSVEAEEGGRLYVTSQARPGATVRLYLNDTLVAPGSAGADGRVAFTIGRGVRPGDYRIRVDQVDPVTGAVKTRSEVAFAVPATVAKPAAPGAKAPAPVLADGGPAAATTAERIAATDQPAEAAAPPARPAPVARPEIPAPMAAPKPAAAAPEAAPPAPAGAPAIFVPEIGTATISRGDSLWQISRRIYGKGTRYTVIYDANQPQIRNPDLIYPGQIFVLPRDGMVEGPQAGTRG